MEATQDLVKLATRVNPAALKRGDEVCYIAWNRLTGDPEVVVGDFLGRDGDRLVVEGLEPTEDGPAVFRKALPPEKVYEPNVALLEAHFQLS